MRNIVLVGFMGTGKTAVGKVLAEKLNMRYVSIDGLIESREGRTIKDIFRDDGEPHFRRVEKEVVREISGAAGQVIDAGGGIVLDEENLRNLQKGGIVICLWAEAQTIDERTKGHGHRPLLNVDDPEKSIKDLLESRKPFYKKADFHVDTTGLDISAVAGRIERILDGKEG